MKKTLLRVAVLVLSLCLVITFAGCKKREPEVSTVVEYEYVSGDDVENETNEKESKSSKDNSTKNNSSNSSRLTASGKQKTKNQATSDAKSRAKDLKGRTITYVAYWEAPGRNTNDGKCIAEVEKLLNCKFEHKMLTDYKALYASILAGKPIADIYATKFDECLNTAAKGLLTPLDTLSSFNFKAARWNQSSIKENTVNGHIYAATSEPQFRKVLLYNMDMFKANNWPDLYSLQKNGELTWDVLYDVMSKAVKLGNDSSPVYGLIPVDTIQAFAQDMLNANGVCALARNGDSTNFTYGLNSEAGIETLNTLVKWNNEKLLFNNEIYGWDSGRSFFASGKSAMIMIDQGHFGTATANANFEYGMVLFPHGPRSQKDLISYQVNAEAIPAGVKNSNDVALFWDLYQDLKYADLDFYANYYDLAPNGTVKSTLEKYMQGIQNNQYIHDWANTWGINMDKYYKEVVDGTTTPAAMVKSIEPKINGIISDFLK